jgi:hypothetical protein
VSHLQIPDEVVAVFHNFRTAELTTIAKDGTPITWPVTVVYDEVSQLFTTSTSIGLPQKAYNIRRNPKVSLLFSEPRACGLKSPPTVLVQGEAQVSDHIMLFDGMEAVWEKIYRFQPSAKLTLYSPIMRNLMDWYYMRLKISIVPKNVLW